MLCPICKCKTTAEWGPCPICLHRQLDRIERKLDAILMERIKKLSSHTSFESAGTLITGSADYAHHLWEEYGAPVTSFEMKKKKP